MYRNQKNWLPLRAKSLRYPFFAVCFLPLAVRHLPGQDSAATVPTIKANVRQVLVPAVVTDKSGHPVSNLKASDFVVFEDEIPQRIVAFSKTYDPALEISNLPPLRNPTVRRDSVSPARIGPDSPTRTYLVCVDTLHSNLGNVAQARRALIKFFQHEHDEKAQYALMNLSRQIDVIRIFSE